MNKLDIGSLLISSVYYNHIEELISKQIVYNMEKIQTPVFIEDFIRMKLYTL
jgi:hypothetical protein